ncbi:hypothetical protein Sru01_09310 [Sphaerisporangium rufum]|uniref:Uncharacterized protein n=1 Tax=Sphaerisporangium rufum TaxID=1381558 RepID=A0A919QXK9_9ACTN|nr:hypothetical protein [Sphaerisporangium rufum]GII75949.1 hypothetical protein Sru01_09310 [Sphaerisporangium rufum]
MTSVHPRAPRPMRRWPATGTMLRLAPVLMLTVPLVLAAAGTVPAAAVPAVRAFAVPGAAALAAPALAWWHLVPPALFFLTSAAQLVSGTVALSRRRGTRPLPSVVALTTVAGLAGVAFTLLAAVTVYRVAAGDAARPAGAGAAWYGTLAALSTVLSLVVLLKGRFRWAAALPALAGVVLVVWWFAYL